VLAKADLQLALEAVTVPDCSLRAVLSVASAAWTLVIMLSEPLLFRNLLDILSPTTLKFSAYGFGKRGDMALVSHLICLFDRAAWQRCRFPSQVDFILVPVFLLPRHCLWSNQLW